MIEQGARSFSSQCLHRIERRGPCCRNHCGDGHARAEHCGGADEGYGIVGAHFIEHPLHHLPDCQADGNSDGHAGNHLQECGAQHERNDSRP